MRPPLSAPHSDDDDDVDVDGRSHRQQLTLIAPNLQLSPSRLRQNACDDESKVQRRRRRRSSSLLRVSVVAAPKVSLVLFCVRACNEQPTFTCARCLFWQCTCSLRLNLGSLKLSERTNERTNERASSRPKLFAGVRQREAAVKAHTREMIGPAAAAL